MILPCSLVSATFATLPHAADASCVSSMFSPAGWANCNGRSGEDNSDLWPKKVCRNVRSSTFPVCKPVLKRMRQTGGQSKKRVNMRLWGDAIRRDPRQAQGNMRRFGNLLRNKFTHSGLHRDCKPANRYSKRATSKPSKTFTSLRTPVAARRRSSSSSSSSSRRGGEEEEEEEEEQQQQQ